MASMPDVADPLERLDIEVEHIAEVGPFIAADRLRSRCDPLQAEPPDPCADRRPWDPESRADQPGGHTVTVRSRWIVPPAPRR